VPVSDTVVVAPRSTVAGETLAIVGNTTLTAA
jgi:hypothetical protein